MSELREPAEVYVAYNDAENRHDLPAIEALVAVDLQVEVNGRRAVASAEEDRAAMAALFEAYPNYRRELLEVLVDGDRATARWRMLGTPAVEGVPVLDVPGVSVVKVVNGQLAQAFLYYDGAALDRVLRSGGASS